MSDTPVIELRSASFGYAGRLVVSHVDLTINRGDVVALLGPNGSGKSTLVKGLLGLDDHLGGEVNLFGTPRAEFTDHSRIGYVPQRHSLSASVRATATEIVAVGRLGLRRWWQLATARDRSAVRDALSAVGLADRAAEEVSTFSGGQQRRVLIARALASEPDVLIMDEPTAGVDMASQEVLARVLKDLADAGSTMLIVTHELEALELVVNRIVCLRDGHIDFDGPPADYAKHEFAHDTGGGHHHHEPVTPVSTPRVIVTDAGPLDPSPRAVRHDG